MSRVSRKSELSPASTRGNNSIDLGKNSGIDMGKKSQPSVTSGGIGITQEVTSVGGMTVSAGANVDITPLDFGINLNPSENTVSVATGAEIPGGILGISGGIEVDLNTGEVIGGNIGGEVGGLGINISNSKKGGLGVEFTVQIPGTPIEFSLGLGFPPKEPTPSPTPSPSPTPTPNLPPGSLTPQQIDMAMLKSPCGTLCVTLHNYFDSDPENPRVTGTEGICLKARRVRNSAGVLTTKTVTSWASEYDDEVGEGETIHSSLGSYDRSFKLYSVGTNRDYYTVSPTTRAQCFPDSEPQPPPRSVFAPFPNPPPRRQKKMDACCRENLAFLRAIYTKLGLARFPGQLPNTIIQEVPKEGEEPAEPPQVPIPDLVTLLNWQFERDDERWGQWQVEINIRDSDVTKEGDQKKQIKLPNLAESIAEFEGQLLSIMTNVDALVALQIKTLAESGMARQEAIKAYLATKAIIKYMAFKSTEVDTPIPMTFTAGAETISELLKESEGHIKGTDYIEKETFRDICLDLLQAAAITRAVHWQRISTKIDTKSQLLSILKGSVDLAASITKPSNGEGGEKPFDPENNFEDFIDNVEDGFRNTTGISDIQNPYGKPPNRRPRIRQIGDNISQAGGND
jgi:hypothetical protein